MGCAQSVTLTSPISIKQSQSTMHHSIECSSFNESIQGLSPQLRINPSSITENVVIIKQPKTKANIEFVQNVLRDHFIFYSLQKEVIQNVIQKMFYCMLKQHTTLYSDNESASCLLIIDRGTLQGSDNQQLTIGTSIGEMALLQQKSKNDSIVAIEDTYFWALDKNSFMSSLDFIIGRQYMSNIEFMSGQSFFYYLSQMQQDAIARNVFVAKYLPGQIIVNEGERADAYYVIKQGQATVFRGVKQIKTITERDSFGEQSLIVHTRRKASVKAITEVHCLILTRDKLKQVVGKDVQYALQQAIVRYSLNRYFNKYLTQIQMEQLIPLFKLKNCVDEIIYLKGDVADRIGIVIEGSLTSTGNQKTIINKGKILFEKPNSLLSTEWRCNGIVALLSYKVISQLFGIDALSQLNANASHTRTLNICKPISMPNIQLSDLQQIQLLGCGQYGHVYQMQYQQKLYAMRYISKEKVAQLGYEKQLLQEKRVLEVLSSPFIANLHRVLKDNLHIYFLQDYVNGIMLSDFLCDEGLLNKDVAQFIIAQMILILEKMHKLQIISREFHADSFMIDQNGHITMIDFKNCKQVGWTYTLMGSPHYIAPEVVRGKGYTCAADAWSVGVCLYEFLCGGVPFGEDTEDPYIICEQIYKSKLAFPSFYQDEQGQSLMRQLLNIEPCLRIGASFAELKAHKWFTLNWDHVYFKQIKKKLRLRMQSNDDSRQIGRFRGQQQQKLRRSNNKEFWDSNFE